MVEEIKKYFRGGNIKYSIYIKKLNTGEIFKINEEERILSASTIKLLIMAEAYNQAKQFKISLGDRIVIEESYRISDSILNLLDKSNTYTIRDLIILMIIQSDNTATNVLIDILGMDNINSFIRSLGLENTKLRRKMLDIDARKLGLENTTSAFDMGKFLELLYGGDIVDFESSMEMIEIMKRQLDNSMMRVHIPDEIDIAHKTGQLENLQHDVGIVFGENTDYVAVFMTWEAENNNYARFCIAEASGEVHRAICSRDNLI